MGFRGQGLRVQDARVQGLGLVGLRMAQGSRSRVLFFSPGPFATRRQNAMMARAV